MRCFTLGLCFLFYVVSLSAADIAVITIAHGKDYQNCVKLGTESKRAYCQKHGYDFIFSEENIDPSRHIYWGKILLVLDVLENSSYKWVVWLDADTLIMNQDVPLEDLIDENYNFCIGYDWNGINSGVFFLRNCNWSKRLLTQVYARTDCLSHQWPEQTAIVRELDEKPEFGSLAKIVPQRLFNAYPPETSGGSLTSTYQPGDFLMHFASIHDHGWLSSIFHKYSQQVVNDRELITLDQYLGYFGFNLSSQQSRANEGFLSDEPYRGRLALYPHIESILEIGLNDGHRAEKLLQNCKRIKKFTSFDRNAQDYSTHVVDYFKRKYKEKFEFIEKDRDLKLHNYASSFPDQRFDLIYIDQQQTKEEINDVILNCRAFAHVDTILWISADSCSMQGAVLSLHEKRLIQITHELQLDELNREKAWIEARYVFP